MRYGYWSALSAMLAMCVGLVLSGCHSASVTDESGPVQPTTAPSVVYVGIFDLGATEVKQDPGTLTGRPRLIQLRPQEDPEQALQDLGDELADHVVIELNDKGIPSERVTPGGAPSQGWIVTGEFLKVDEGNRLQRAVMGFGIGNSSAELYVAVADLAHPEGKNLFDFNSDTSASKAPGGSVAAVAGHSPWGMVAKFALEKDASDKDIKAIAKAIAEEIAKRAGKE